MATPNPEWRGTLTETVCSARRVPATRLIALLLLLLTQPVLAFEYLLAFEQVCGYEQRAFPCKNSSERVTIQQRLDGKWVGVNQTGSVVELRVMKNDEYVLVLENPVYFSGTSVIHLMKKTGRFYWSEFSYSEILKVDDGTVRVGRMTLSMRGNHVDC